MIYKFLISVRTKIQMSGWFEARVLNLRAQCKKKKVNLIMFFPFWETLMSFPLPALGNSVSASTWFTRSFIPNIHTQSTA